MAAVGVKPPRGPEHDVVAAIAAAVRVRRGVRPGTVGHPAIRLDLDHHRTHTPSGNSCAEQPMRGRDRVDRQFLSVHQRRLCTGP